MEDTCLQIAAGTGIQTPKTAERISLKKRFTQRLTELYSTGKEENHQTRKPEKNLSTISMNVDLHTVSPVRMSPVDVKQSSGDSAWSHDGVFMERI
ncbi:hypothetical protein OUZ56_008704 [Daphnia magna]|uniref:Uncharacterized protein n=1 Tax=Daphnia magna TaxID=35525 RepID=A0ABR0ADT0_9CRUS|nr:hypothetical protein OUZ56_008704 [Daphnia magna]